MTTVLIVLHVLAAVLFIGPTTVAVSAFQGQAVKAHTGDTRAAGTAALLHRITRSYGVLSSWSPCSAWPSWPPTGASTAPWATSTPPSPWRSLPGHCC